MTRDEIIRDIEERAYGAGAGQYMSLRCDVAREILVLLRDQEARLVTTADFENNHNLDDSGHLNVWEEYKDSTRSGWNTINVNDVIAFTDIRRYWTARPTEEQRKAVKWDD